MSSRWHWELRHWPWPPPPPSRTPKDHRSHCRDPPSPPLVATGHGLWPAPGRLPSSLLEFLGSKIQEKSVTIRQKLALSYLGIAARRRCKKTCTKRSYPRWRCHSWGSWERHPFSRLSVLPRHMVWTLRQNPQCQWWSWPIGIWKIVWLVVEPYPSEKYEFVSWDDDIPNIWKYFFKKMFQTTNQLLVETQCTKWYHFFRPNYANSLHRLLTTRICFNLGTVSPMKMTKHKSNYPSPTLTVWWPQLSVKNTTVPQTIWRNNHHSYRGYPLVMSK